MKLFKVFYFKKYFAFYVLLLASPLSCISNSCTVGFKDSGLNNDQSSQSTKSLPLITSQRTPLEGLEGGVSGLQKISLRLKGLPESSPQVVTNPNGEVQVESLEGAIVSLVDKTTSQILSVQKSTGGHVLKFYIPQTYQGHDDLRDILDRLQFVIEAPGYGTKKMDLSSLDLSQLVPVRLKDDASEVDEIPNADESVDQSTVSVRTFASNGGSSGADTPEGGGGQPRSTIYDVYEDPNREDPVVTVNLESERMLPQENLFHYQWESDGSGLEEEQTMGEPQKPQIEFLDEVINPSNLSYASSTLEGKYNLVLSNNGNVPWSADLSQRLLKVVEDLPHHKIEHKTFVELSSLHLPDDVLVTKQNINGKSRVTKITLSHWAFNYSLPKLVKIDGKKAKFFSRRLYHAMVYFFTDEGRNLRAVKKILWEKFGLKLHEEVRNYKRLTATNEPKEHFQRFQPNELVFIINVMYEMPAGYYKIPGLRYLLRRKEGHPHPLYPMAAAVAWPRGPNTESYVEFMTKAFDAQSPDQIHRLILHEKSHFIYANLLNEETHRDWATVGGWYRDPEDMDNWLTNQTTTFVTPYAHAHGPGEDFAESVSYYVINPQKLLNFAPEKYNFIANRVMNAYRYHTQVREDLTFQVLNLYPDYDFPGKIREVDVKARGAPSEDKQVTVQIKLYDDPNYDDGARYAFTRISSPVDTFKDLYMYPVNGDSHTLRGTLTIPAHAAQGYWTVNQIIVTDRVKNRRMQGINTFGFKLYINNPDEDLLAPQYVADSLEITSVEENVAENRRVHNIYIRWDINENKNMASSNSVHANLVYDGQQREDLYPLFNYGGSRKVEGNGEIIRVSGQLMNRFRAQVKIRVTDFFRNGRYAVTYIGMIDKALNRSGQYFSDSNEENHESLRYITIDTSDPDAEKPMVDLNNIQINATPTNPSNPNGETSVRIRYRAKDNKSGVGKVYYLLLDPVGKTHHYSHRHSNFHTLFFKGGDPTQYKDYNVSQILPRGSAPGTWGLKEMIVEDKAGNIKSYDFSEVYHFEIND